MGIGCWRPLPPGPVADVGAREVAPGPLRPVAVVVDVIGWHPTGEQEGCVMHDCPACGCAQAVTGACWQCGEMVRP